MVLFTGRHSSWPNYRMGLAGSWSTCHLFTPSFSVPFFASIPGLGCFLCCHLPLAHLYPMTFLAVKGVAFSVAPLWSHPSYRDYLQHLVLFCGTCLGWLSLCARVTGGQVLGALHLWVRIIVLHTCCGQGVEISGSQCVLTPFILPSLFLFRLGLAPQIHDLYGKVKFTGKPAPSYCPY